MAASLDKLENKVEICNRHVKYFHMVKRLRKSVQYIWRYSTKYAEPRREHTTQFPLVCSPPSTGPIFTKILHNIVALVAPECQSDESVEFAIFSQNWLPWHRTFRYRKKSPHRSSAPKTLLFGEKIAKIGPADPEIICLREIIKKKIIIKKEKKKEIMQAKYIARSTT